MAATLCESLLHGVVQRGQSRGEILAEMNAQGAAATFGENGKISTRLRGFHDAEGIGLLRHENVTGSGR